MINVTSKIAVLKIRTKNKKIKYSHISMHRSIQKRIFFLNYTNIFGNKKLTNNVTLICRGRQVILPSIQFIILQSKIVDILI